MKKFEIYIPKANETFTVNFAALPEQIKIELIAYGLKQKLNDKVSDVKVGEDNAVDIAKGQIEGLLESLQAGVWSHRGTGTKTVTNPVEKEAVRLATEQVKQAFRMQSIPLKGSQKKVKELVTKLLEENGDTFREEARKNLETLNSLNINIEF
jgi:hypothetical protein